MFLNKIGKLNRVHVLIKTIPNKPYCWFSISGFMSLSTLYRSYHNGKLEGQRKPVHKLVKVLYCKLPTNGKQLPALGSAVNRTPASEVGGESVTTLPPWPPTLLLESFLFGQVYLISCPNKTEFIIFECYAQLKKIDPFPPPPTLGYFW